MALDLLRRYGPDLDGGDAPAGVNSLPSEDGTYTASGVRDAVDVGPCRPSAGRAATAGLTWLRRPASPACRNLTQHRGHPPVAMATGLTSAARMGVLAETAASVTGGSRGIDKRIGGVPTPDGAAVVLSFVCNRTLAEQVAAAVQTPGGRPPAMNHVAATAAAVGGPE
jgi:hypothetical protein